MKNPAPERRDRSARHYVKDEPQASRLQTTVVLAARALDFPIAMVNILDEDTQHTISVSGIGDVASIPREESLCQTVIAGKAPVVSSATVTDDRFASLPWVVDGTVGSYVGVPLKGREAEVVGVLCVVDSRERAVEASDVARLVEFGKVVEDQLDLMRLLDTQRRDVQVATSDLVEAIELDQIVPWYQPVMELSSGRLRSFEALARWEHPSGRVLQPKNFVPLAEDSDLIIDMDLKVMHQALRQLGEWRKLAPDLRMNVNLSGRHFDHEDWLEPIRSAVQQADVPPRSVNIEITETALLPNMKRLSSGVRQLTDLGFNVWLDDFGTGWSSLEYLLRMPVHGIKLSQVVSVTLGSPVGNALVRAVTGLAAELGLYTTIEGIETRETEALARKLGCDNAQGYLWSAALTSAAVSASYLRDDQDMQTWSTAN